MNHQTFSSIFNIDLSLSHYVLLVCIPRFLKKAKSNVTENEIDQIDFDKIDMDMEPNSGERKLSLESRPDGPLIK